jgi:N-acetylglucosaminyl-diphospho-decaprenol L-rhamnosyltransferase
MLRVDRLNITISLVSHGHGALVQRLVEQLAVLDIKSTIDINLVITNNLPNSNSFSGQFRLNQYPFAITFLCNETPLGFGANHNQAFRHCNSDFFCVLNPDIELTHDPFTTLVNAFTDPKIGLTYPSQTDVKDVLLDFERELVDPASVARRHLIRSRYHPDRNTGVHWVSGAFMMFKSSAFRKLGGFDERYFMYCEDVDICLRLQLAGYKLARADATVIHHTQRRTLKNLQHLVWHVRSLLRLWNSASYKQYKQRFIDKEA